MRIAPDAYRWLAGLGLASALLGSIHGLWAIGLALAACAVAFFFRDPQRRIPSSRRAIVSPADGKIVGISTSVEAATDTPPIRVSILLSIWDVHVNRSPIEGWIRRIRHTPGRFLPAFLSRASRENESNRLWIVNDRLGVAVRQIAGSVTRRIVCYRKEGDLVGRGERIGLIRFGSRVELDLPPASRICVQVGDRVRAGETIVAWEPEGEATP